MEATDCLKFSRWYADEYPSEAADHLDEFGRDTRLATDFEDPVSGLDSACEFVGWFCNRFESTASDRIAEWENLGDIGFDPVSTMRKRKRKH